MSILVSDEEAALPDSAGTSSPWPEYKRSDFGVLVQGKYAARLAEESNVVALEPEVAKVFPNDKVVNEALRGLIKIAESAARPAHVELGRARAD
jgi:hypothetical protein